MNIRKFLAPVVIAAIILGLTLTLSALGIDSNPLYDSGASLIAVILGYRLWPSSPISVAAVLILVSIIFPISVLYAIGNNGNLETNLSEIFKHIEWHLVLWPFVIGVSVSVILRYLTNRSNRDRANRAAP